MEVMNPLEFPNPKHFNRAALPPMDPELSEWLEVLNNDSWHYFEEDRTISQGNIYSQGLEISQNDNPAVNREKTS
eukprot:CAMPEP_0203759888 /NCGR_PEP_ID=MMETSP0098-20131031/13204_1 /ASSEMBLY_ACC=CAM_ASM_000208 /TAXON_ID=96639 /ORGANISM=" , Strain NY0313808BC1" /LENGTH=74 /DNA_ID=CAMNT_0050653189 /DNA_START=151 /DNA_END=372 /DNA_ORIENTATION=-